MIVPQCSSNSNPAPLSSNKAAVHENSDVICKLIKPKIRIIHVCAPEIIKTDVANFRELVQRLTGKPEANTRKKNKKNKKNKKKITANNDNNNNKSMKLQDEWRSLELVDGSEKIIKEGANGTWGDGDRRSSTTFFDLDGFIQELSDSSYAAPMKYFPMNTCA